MKLKNKAQIEAWLADGDLENVLDELIRQLKASKSAGDLLKTATSLSGQMNKLKTDKLNGVITYEQETVTFNKLQVKVQNFVEAVEKDKPPKPPIAEPPTTPSAWPVTQTKSSSGMPDWLWWVMFAAVSFGTWWYFFGRDEPVKSLIRICTMENFSPQNWCDNDMTRLSIVEAVLQHPVVTAAFKGLEEADPLILATVYDSDGNVFPTQKIQLTMAAGGLGYAAEMKTAEGVTWKSGFYSIKLQYNGEEAGEKQFEIFNDRQFLGQ